MNSDMERLCEAVEVVCDHHGMMACDEDHKAIVRAVLTAMKSLERPTLEAVGHFNADYSFDNGRDPPFSRQLSVAIDAILVTENYLAEAGE